MGHPKNQGLTLTGGGFDRPSNDPSKNARLKAAATKAKAKAAALLRLRSGQVQTASLHTGKKCWVTSRKSEEHRPAAAGACATKTYA